MFIALSARFSLLQRLMWMWFMTAKMLHPAPSKQGAISHYLSWWISLLLLNQCHLMLLAVWRTGLLAHAPIILICPCPIHQSYTPPTLCCHWWERGGTDVQQFLRRRLSWPLGLNPLNHTITQWINSAHEGLSAGCCFSIVVTQFHQCSRWHTRVGVLPWSCMWMLVCRSACFRLCADGIKCRRCWKCL